MTVTDQELLKRILTGHTPVVLLCGEGHVHPRGCSCGLDPLDFVEHLARRLIAGGFLTLTAAAELVEAEHASEVDRLTKPECPDPFQVPMLGNWLGGIHVAAKVLRDHAAARGAEGL